jgi:hypothetical protein
MIRIVVVVTTVSLLLLTGMFERTDSSLFSGRYCVSGFTTIATPVRLHHNNYVGYHERCSKQQSARGNSALPDDWLEGIQNFWNSIIDNDSSNSVVAGTMNTQEEELPAGTSLILSIPVRQLKPGGLRLFLMFCLMGLQNTPTSKTWRAHQPVSSPNGSRFEGMTEVIVHLPDENNDDNAQQPGTQEEYILEMIHHDRTGTVAIELIPPPTVQPLSSSAAAAADSDSNKFGEVRILRSGSNPSNSYLMNEAVILDGILDELHKCAFDETIPEASRLIVPVTSDAIDVAREELAFG